jgi:hypothetical protein
VTNDERLIEAHLRDACDAVRTTTGTQSRIMAEHYGSGYASFVDAWFFKTTSDFNVKLQRPWDRLFRFGERHTGLVVLLSRLSPYFVLMEG